MKLTGAIIFLVLGVLIQISNKFLNQYKDWARKNPVFKGFVFWGSILLLLYGGYQTYIILKNSEKYKIFASPAEVRLHKYTNKDFILTITNNQDFPLYGVNFSCCANDRNFDMSLINISSANTIFRPGLPYSIIGWNFTNGYKGIMFENINPHSSKEFHVIIHGDKIKTDTKLSFKVTYWEAEPTSFSLKTTKEQAEKSRRDFQEIYSNDAKESDKDVNVTVKVIRLDKNPYFPKAKSFIIKSTFQSY